MKNDLDFAPVRIRKVKFADHLSSNSILFVEVPHGRIEKMVRHPVTGLCDQYWFLCGHCAGVNRAKYIERTEVKSGFVLWAGCPIIFGLLWAEGEYSDDSRSSG